MIERRSFLRGLGAFMAAPAIVYAGNLMPVKALPANLMHISEVGFWEDGDMTYAAFDPRELAAITRRAFVPRLQVQIYQSTPLLRAILGPDGRNHQSLG